MTQRSFETDTYAVLTGWDRPLQYHFLVISQRDQPDEEPIFSNLYLQNPAMSLEAITATMTSFGITAPPALLADLREDARLNRGNVEQHYDSDPDVHYDPETGTASVQAEYGDRPDLGNASAAEPVEGHRLQPLADRIREWFQRDRDRGMEW